MLRDGRRKRCGAGDKNFIHVGAAGYVSQRSDNVGQRPTAALRNVGFTGKTARVTLSAIAFVPDGATPARRTRGQKYYKRIEIWFQVRSDRHSAIIKQKTSFCSIIS